MSERLAIAQTEQQVRSFSAPAVVLAFPGGKKLTVLEVRPPQSSSSVEERAGEPPLPSAPVAGERPTLFHHGLREWLRVTLIVSLAAHAIVFLIFQFRFDDDLERAAGAAAALASDGTITVPVEVVLDPVLPSAPSPADASSSETEQANPTPPIDIAQPDEPDLAKLVELMPPPPEPAPVVLPTPESLVQLPPPPEPAPVVLPTPESLVQLPEPPEPAPVVLPTQQEAMELALPEEEIAKPIEAETAAVAEAPAAPAREEIVPPMPPVREPIREAQERAPPPKQTARPPAPQKSAPSRAASPSRAAAANSPGTSGAGGTRDTGGRAAVSSYFARIQAHLLRHRVYPPEARARGITGVAQVVFSLGRDGRVLSVSLARGSGHRVLDEAALDMVRRAAPYPPIPPEIAASRLEMGAPIRFDLR
jgi:periplasmic protein TonB